jgi:hypothetical protein
MITELESIVINEKIEINPTIAITDTATYGIVFLILEIGIMLDKSTINLAAAIANTGNKGTT